MTEPTRSFMSSRLPLRLAFVVAAASLVLFWPALREVTELSLSDDRYAYLLLIPANSAVVLYLERQRIFSAIGTYRSTRVSPLLAGALVTVCLLGGLLAWDLLPLRAEYQLTIKVVFMLLAWAAAFALCCGVPALIAAK